MMHTDPPEHTRYRKLVRPGFTQSVVRSLEDLVRTRTGALLDQLAASSAAGAPVDVVSELAVPLPIQLIAQLLGLPPDDELGMFLIQLLVAGNETTRHAISGTFVALADHPEQHERLAADPSLVPSAVEEALRWTTPVTSFLRTAVDDTELSGTAIAAGDPVLLLYASANRDEAEFGPTADTFDVGRTPNHHVALGFGPHFCLGAALARLELTALLEGILERWSHIGRAGDVERSGSSVISGIRRAPLHLTPIG
jgi:cytochrome P450